MTGIIAHQTVNNSIRLLFLCLSLWLLTGTSTSAAEGRIIVGLHENTPLLFTDTDSRIKGIVADLLAHFTDEKNLGIQYLPGSYAECIRRLEAGTIDLLPGMATTSVHASHFTLGNETIVSNWGQLYTAADAEFTDILDFHGKAVAVVKADIYSDFFKTMVARFEIHPRFVPVDTYGDVFSLIRQEKVAAGIVSRLYGSYHAERFGVHKSPVSFKPTELRFAVARGRNETILASLDYHLKALKAQPNSIFYRSVHQWTQGVRKLSLPLWLRPLWVLGFTAGIMGLIIAGNIFLRRQVKLQTEALKTTIAEKEKIVSELSVAREIQLQLVPGDFPAFSNRKEFDIHARLEPAREVGGDFYDCFFIDGNHLCLVIGDVSGKGVPAALFMAMTKTMIKSAARLLAEPEYILADVNREIARNNPSLTFVTVFVGVLNLNSGNLTYTCAGHIPQLFIGRKGNSALLSEAPCPAIGFDDTYQYRQATIKLQHQEGLLLFTDGVTEAQNAQGQLFTQEALMNTVSLTAGLSPQERVTAIIARIREFTDQQPLDDDLTLLALTYFSPHRVSDTGKTIVLKNKIQEVDRIVQAISKVGSAAGCPPVVVHDVTLAIEEIFSNIVFYGFGDDLDHNITLELFVEENSLILILQDGGIPFNPLNLQVGGRDKPLEERDKGGMGIILAKNLMDRMDYRRERGHNILRMEKRFR